MDYQDELQELLKEEALKRHGVLGKNEKWDNQEHWPIYGVLITEFVQEHENKPSRLWKPQK